MAGLTRHAAGVLLCRHLREILRPRGAGAVTPHAQHPRIEFGRRHRGIGRMGRQGTMAGFAVYPFVFPLVLHFRFVGVAGFASLVAGEFCRMRGDLVHGGSAVVPVLSEGLGYDEATNGPEEQESDNKKARKSEKMSRILENVHADQASLGRTEECATPPHVIQII